MSSVALNMPLIYSRASSDVISGCGEQRSASTRSAGDQIGSFEAGDVDNGGGGGRLGGVALLGDVRAAILSVKSVTEGT